MTPPAAPTRTFVNTKGERLAFATYGTPADPAVLLVHGWTGFGDEWTPLARTLAAHNLFVIVPDLLGHAASAAPRRASYAIAAQAERLWALVAALGADRVALVGHSMGGQIVQYMAQHAPHHERVWALVSVSGVTTGALTPGVRLRRPLIQLMALVPPLAALLRPVAEHVRPLANILFGRVWYADIGEVPRASWRGHAHSLLNPARQKVYADALREIHSTDVSVGLGRLALPTLVLFGDTDRAVPLSEGDTLVARVAGAQKVVLPGVGHQPMHEAPDATVRHISTFLAGTRPDPA